MVEIEVVQAGVEDLERLREIARTTFLETFAESNSGPNMDAYLAERMSAEQFRRELDNPESAFYLTVHGGETVGYLKVNTGAAQTEPQENALEIERIYVRQAFHGKAVGQMLYDLALRLAREKGVDYIWLGVWEANGRAIRFYEKNGFARFGEHTFRFGDEDQIDLMLKKQL